MCTFFCLTPESSLCSAPCTWTSTPIDWIPSSLALSSQWRSCPSQQEATVGDQRLKRKHSQGIFLPFLPSSLPFLWQQLLPLGPELPHTCPAAHQLSLGSGTTSPFPVPLALGNNRFQLLPVPSASLMSVLLTLSLSHQRSKSTLH